MPDTKKQDEFYQKILNSHTFQSSKINRDLLQYLYEKSCNQETPREIDIAIELLGQGKNFDPANDTFVRSRVYKLRQKLAAYYQNEGASDEYQLVIPKGSYRLEFIRSEQRTKKNQTLLILLIALVLSLVVNVSLMISKSGINEQRLHQAGNHPFWSGFLNNDLPTLFVVGDFFTFIEYNPENGTERVIRDYDINSKEDFEAYVRKNPGLNVQMNENYRSIAWTAVENVLKVSGLFYTNHASLMTKRASQLSWEDVRHSNIIFEGHPRSLFILNRVLKMTDLDISREVPFDVYVTANHTDTLQVYRSNYWSPGVLSSYVVVVKIPGPSGNYVFLCVAHDEMPRTFIIEQLTHIDFLEELDATFKDKLGEIPAFFEMVIRVDGFPRTGFKHQVVYVKKFQDTVRDTLISEP